ncbi:MAG: TetR/AcrR family transcriptional regulator [Alphaproteobacteria bacterium]
MALKSALNREKTRDARRHQILDAALDSIAENGLADTTLATVAKKAGLSQASLVFHFKSKDALLTEALRCLNDEYDNNWKQALQNVGSHPVERVCTLVEAYFHKSVCSRKRIGVWFAFWGEAKSQPTYLEICGAGDQERCDAMERECFRLLEQSGQDPEDAPDVALMIDGLCDGLMQSLLINYKEFGRKDAMRVAFGQLARLFPVFSEMIAVQADKALAGPKRKAS